MTNLAGAEEVEILFSIDGGDTFEPLSQDGADLVLSATANTYRVESAMFLGVLKDATASAAGVFIMRGNPEAAF